MPKNTRRLYLRQFTLEDANDMFALAKDPDVGPRCGWKPHADVNETKTILEKYLINDHTWAITDKETDVLYGLISLDNDGRRRIPGYRMMGYWIGKAYWGKGIVVEAGREILRYGFEELNLNMISISHFPFNTQSKRVIEKLGFVYEGQLRETYFYYTGEVYDEVCYSLKRAEYKQNNC